MAYSRVSCAGSASAAARAAGVAYVANPEKTASLSDAARAAHSVRGEERDIIPPGGFVSAVGVRDARHVVEDFARTHAFFGSSGSPFWYHVIQSFAPGDNVTPGLAHEIGIELAAQLGRSGEALIATHLNRAHIHNHILLNAVCLRDGKPVVLGTDRGARRHVQAICDRICRAHGLASFLGNSGPARRSERASPEHRENVKDACRNDVHFAARQAGTVREILPELKLLGYDMRRGLKDNLIRPPESPYWFTPRRLFAKPDWEKLAVPAPSLGRLRCARVSVREVTPAKPASRLAVRYALYCATLSQQRSFRPREAPFREYRFLFRRLEELKFLRDKDIGSLSELERLDMDAKTQLAQGKGARDPFNPHAVLRACAEIVALDGLADLSKELEQELIRARELLEKNGFASAEEAKRAAEELLAVQRERSKRRRELLQIRRMRCRIAGQLAQMKKLERVLYPRACRARAARAGAPRNRKGGRILPDAKPEEKKDKTLHPAIEFELRRAREDHVDLTGYPGYTSRQLREIRLALKKWGNADFLTDLPRDYLQMELLRQGRLERLETSFYSDPAFDCNQMWEILQGLRAHVEVARYARPEYSDLQMRQIRLGLEDGLDTTGYERAELSAEQMLKERLRAPRMPFRTRLILAGKILFRAGKTKEEERLAKELRLCRLGRRL